MSAVRTTTSPPKERRRPARRASWFRRRTASARRARMRRARTKLDPSGVSSASRHLGELVVAALEADFRGAAAPLCACPGPPNVGRLTSREASPTPSASPPRRRLARVAPNPGQRLGDRQRELRGSDHAPILDVAVRVSSYLAPVARSVDLAWRRSRVRAAGRSAGRQCAGFVSQASPHACSPRKQRAIALY